MIGSRIAYIMGRGNSVSPFPLVLVLILLSLPAFSSANIKSIGILAPRETLTNLNSRQSIEDVRRLLKKACDCRVAVNDPSGEYLVHLPRITSAARYEMFPRTQVPDAAYNWTVDPTRNIWLEATTAHGVSAGLYGLLQEVFGFGFYHPRETRIPNLKEWPRKLDQGFTFSGRPRFDVRGFHLHTQHPLELTEQLHDPKHPTGFKDIKEYIDWLVRNQQNFFQFVLLESIDLETWPEYAKIWVDYAHSRGILVSLDVSLHMIQQKSFMLVEFKPKDWTGFEKQIDEKLERLFVADWDCFNVEFATAEFVGGYKKRKGRLRKYLHEQLTQNYKCRMMGRTHVVKESDEKGGGEKKEIEEDPLDSLRIVLVHTVMAYSITDSIAPVYESENLRHMMKVLKNEQATRETWYFPESAYWVTYDNSIPLILLPYLSARLEDLETMEKEGINAHVTFSSGWEWGYWLNDWSIARWSWEFKENGRVTGRSPLQFLGQLTQNEEFTKAMEDALRLQKKELLDQNLLRLMCASNPTDELPGPLYVQFQPRPEWKYSWIWKKASYEDCLKLMETEVAPLHAYSGRMEMVLEKLYGAVGKQYSSPHNPLQPTEEAKQLQQNYLQFIQMDILRAKHRAATLSALIFSRMQRLAKGKEKKEILQKEIDQEMEKARKYREMAQGVVRTVEKGYRYPHASIAMPYESHTAYDHGYLYTVTNLHFWQREEAQVRYKKFGAFYRNIYKLGKISGLKD